MKLRILFSVILVVLMAGVVLAENENKKDKSAKGYVFEDEIIISSTSIKDQYRTGTCWSFSGLSFLESEMLNL